VDYWLHQLGCALTAKWRCEKCHPYLSGCDYSGQDLTGKVLSGVLASNANFEGAKVGLYKLNPAVTRS
jgi:uncharacterized protein YjbI with pentapeptide repeats